MPLNPSRELLWTSQDRLRRGQALRTSPSHSVMEHPVHLFRSLDAQIPDCFTVLCQRPRFLSPDHPLF